MVKRFACPECGAEVTPAGLSPGRQVRCPDCLTWVEVPFIPRQLPRGRRRTTVWKAWAPAGLLLLGLVVAALLVLGTRRWFQADVQKQVDALVAEAQEHESQGNLGPALEKFEGALKLARDRGISPASGLDDLQGRRDKLALRQAKAQLDHLATDGSDADIGEAQRLLVRVEGDPALESLTGPARDLFGQRRDRWAEALLGEARRAFDAGRFDQVLSLCERMQATVDAFPPGTAAGVPAAIRDLVAQAVQRTGVVLAPIQGSFLLGSAAAYDAALHPLLDGALRRLGYLPQPASSPFGSLWASSASHRLEITIKERQPGPYLQTPHRLSEIEAQLTLNRSGSPAWSDQLTVRTRVPLAASSAADLRRLGLSTRPDPAVERRLYDDARDFLRDQITLRLRNIPAPP